MKTKIKKGIVIAMGIIMMIVGMGILSFIIISLVQKYKAKSSQIEAER